METLTTIRPELLTITRAQALVLLPYLFLFAGTIFTILFGVMRKIPTKWPVFIVFMTTVIAAFFSSLQQMGNEPVVLFNGMMVIDNYSNFFNLVYMAAAALTGMSALKYLDKEDLQYPEFFILILFSVIGMMFLSSSLDLIVLFIGLEIMSVAVYVLVGFRRTDRRSNEAAMKYFILGSAASALLLYGTALMYGATGSTNVRTILGLLQSQPAHLGVFFVMGSWLAVIGFLFKVAAVPFHMWMPDVYEGALTPITGFMTTGLKAAAFAAFVRVLLATGYGSKFALTLDGNLHHVLWVVAVLTMVVGNVIALTQTNLKRMLAYSSISHSGYIIVGMLAGPHSEQGFAPVVLYLVAYSIMNLGAFAVLTLLAQKNDAGLNLHDISGLSRKHPWLAFGLAVFLFSMAGIPPTAGFMAKYLLFYSAVQANEILLVVISVLCSAISVYYYLRVMVYMYMREPAVGESGQEVSRGSALGALAVAALVALTLQVGISPSFFVNAAKRAITSL